ncbi:uncharacterized protein LOC131825504 [Mustela lutreola]|uniref:uncharacterized protein LOC131825504 n=1 Tax=Mustela lutreola TaxID=9666 RepID=UPI0027971995|nr:uncharacterized protein LOC131825504 [Mustela lutreola]
MPAAAARTGGSGPPAATASALPHAGLFARRPRAAAAAAAAGTDERAGGTGGAGARVVTHATAGVRAPADRRPPVRVRRWAARRSCAVSGRVPGMSGLRLKGVFGSSHSAGKTFHILFQHPTKPSKYSRNQPISRRTVCHSHCTITPGDLPVSNNPTTNPLECLHSSLSSYTTRGYHGNQTHRQQVTGKQLPPEEEKHPNSPRLLWEPALGPDLPVYIPSAL